MYGISEKDEDEIRSRDKSCVYCHKKMKRHFRKKGTPSDKATIEHLYDGSPLFKNLAICCGSCNSSRGPKELLDWFESPYCKDNNINRITVSSVIRRYIQTQC